MKTDRELLELAARAAGYEVYKIQHDIPRGIVVRKDGLSFMWMPLIDDGAALRLAVITDQIVEVNRVDGFVSVQCGYHGEITITEDFDSCMFAATRRAITRAAAEIQLQKEREQ